jgi:hypothetical protein
MTTDILVGRQEIVCEPQRGLSVSFWNFYSCVRVWLITVHAELEIAFRSVDGHSGHPAEPVTVFLTIAVTVPVNASASPSLTAAVNTSSPAAIDIPVSEGSAMRPTAQTSTEKVQSSTLVERAGDSETVAETSRTGLRRAEEAVNIVNAVTTWKSAVTVIKRVMDVVTPIAVV